MLTRMKVSKTSQTQREGGEMEEGKEKKNWNRKMRAKNDLVRIKNRLHQTKTNKQFFERYVTQTCKHKQIATHPTNRGKAFFWQQHKVDPSCQSSGTIPWAIWRCRDPNRSCPRTALRISQNDRVLCGIIPAVTICRLRPGRGN